MEIPTTHKDLFIFLSLPLSPRQLAPFALDNKEVSRKTNFTVTTNMIASFLILSVLFPFAYGQAGLRGADSRELISEGRQCTNNNVWGNLDIGCDLQNPICVSDETYELSFWGTGTKCAHCLNPYEDNSGNAFVDFGCSSASPMCVLDDLSQPVLWHGGDKCVRCINNSTFGQTDMGCTSELPFCVGFQNTLVGKDQAGSGCVTCNEIVKSASVCLNIDESGSINAVNFQKVKDFATSLIASISDETASGMSEFAAVFFGATANLATDLTDPSTASSIIQSEQYSQGSTNLGAGVGLCNSVLSGADFAMKLMITVTDGNPTTGPDHEPLVASAKESGVILVSVSVGNNVDQEFMESLASTPDFLFNVDDFDGLPVIIDQIAQEASCSN